MSSFDRRVFTRSALALGSALLTGGCFKPMLAEDNDAAEIRGRIAFPAVEGRFGYFLNKTLEDRLGKVGDADWA